MVSQPVVRVGAEAGLARRFGAPGRLGLLGFVLSAERLTIEGSPLAGVPADDAAAGAALAGRWSERRRIRAHLVVGARRLRFHRAAGIDAVNQLEDVREGLEIGIVAGRSIGGGAGLQHDWFAAVEAFRGWRAPGSPGTWWFARGKAEGRWLAREGRWDGLIASGQLLRYSVVSERGVLVLGLSGDGGWQTELPFQLLLAGPNGVRGYGVAQLPVGRRVVALGEHRYFVGTLFEAADVGAAVFVDVGHGWAGDAAFGEDVGTVAAIGGGLRLAFPSGSRRVYRLELSLPTSRGLGPELRFAFGQQFGLTRGEADDVVRSREALSAATVFNFPRY